MLARALSQLTSSSFSCMRSAPLVLMTWLIVSRARSEEPHTDAPRMESAPSSLPRIALADALTEALRREPRVELSRLEIERAEALVRQARASAFPTLTGNVTYTRLDDERASSTGTRFAGRDQLNANLQASLPLLAPQRWVAARRVRDLAEVTRLSAEEVRRQVALATARAYLAVVSQKRAIEVHQRAVDNAVAHYQNAHARFTGGIGNELDDVRSAQEVESSTAQLESARAGLVSAQEALGVLLGSEGPIDASEPEVLSAASERPASDAIERRGDVRAGRARVHASERAVRDHWADYMPLLTGVFQPFYQNPPTVQFPKTGWQAQLILTVPLYDGGLRYGLQEERRALAAQSRTQLEAVLRQARAELRAAFATLERADKSLASAQRAAELSGRALTMATLAYAAGATTNIEVVDAERRARDAESAAVIAEDAARRARLDLMIATGQLP